jgi:hypothetical protein
MGFTTVNTIVVAPIPSAMVRIVKKENAGALHRLRNAYFMLRRMSVNVECHREGTRPGPKMKVTINAIPVTIAVAQNQKNILRKRLCILSFILAPPSPQISIRYRELP